MNVTESAHAGRVSAYATVRTRLSLFSDRQLEDAVAAAPSLGSGIGGRSAQMEIEGIRVFVKRVPLTDIELQPEHARSTRNMFELPPFYQYGAGSAGFGAWRELTAHIMTTGWTLTNEYAGFPLLYHWRVLPDTPPLGFIDKLGGIDAAVAHWEGSPAVRHRLEAIGHSSHSLVLFLEHVPQTLAEWLADTHKATPPQQGDESPYRWVENTLLQGTQFMSAHGLVHFDTHFTNLLTDGQQIYFADFGLALSREFELSKQERDFLTDHLMYDRTYAPNHLLHHHLPDDLRRGTEHGTFLSDWLDGHQPAHVPPDIAAILDRHAPHAIVLDDFHHRLLTQSKHTPFPTAEIQRALAGTTRPAE